MSGRHPTPWQQILDEIRAEVEPQLEQGRVADYIPQLGGISPHKFGLAVHTLEGETF